MLTAVINKVVVIRRRIKNSVEFIWTLRRLLGIGGLPYLLFVAGDALANLEFRACFHAKLPSMITCSPGLKPASITVKSS